jgi:peptidoglycan/LPS O-acetylase OafA/YrhL
LPYWIVLAGVAAGLLTVRGGNQAVRGGTLVIAGALLAGALARLVLPERRVGMLASRRRVLDVAALAILGIGLLVAALIAKVPGS